MGFQPHLYSIISPNISTYKYFKAKSAYMLFIYTFLLVMLYFSRGAVRLGGAYIKRRHSFRSRQPVMFVFVCLEGFSVPLALQLRHQRPELLNGIFT